MNSGFPRTLLLTWQRPDGRYAGAEVLRKIVRRLPQKRVRWAYLAAPAPSGLEALPESRGFEAVPVHWRLRNTAWRYLYTQHVQARRMAREIEAWVRPFEPQVLWTLAELGAVTVGYSLHRRLGVPVHATVHDAYEFGHFSLPRRYYPVYFRSATRLLRHAASFDAVSNSLRDHVVSRYGGPEKASLVFPPSASPALVAPAGKPAFESGRVRKIGLCGSMRILEREWSAFLALLATLPCDFEIQAFVEKDGFFSVPLPSNVRLVFAPYQKDEETLISSFREAGLHAAYLGLTKNPQQACFCRYSLSSKLAPYAAAGLPVIVDGPADSEGWNIVNRHGAGVLCAGDEAASLQALQRLFADTNTWTQMSDGAIRLCREELNLEKNMERFKETISRTAAGE